VLKHVFIVTDLTNAQQLALIQNMDQVDAQNVRRDMSWM
jgi:hypothetical protein